MDPQFWAERWASGQIGFHLDAVNPRLQAHWPTVAGDHGAGRVLVPLCGKSRDLLWLHQRGHRVLGVELSALACDAFFAEHELPYVVEPVGDRGMRYRGEGAAVGLELLQGDLFAFGADDFGAIDLLYDRASVIALPPTLRAKLVQTWAIAMSAGARGLVVTLDYPQDERDGPPFAVPTTELRALAGDAFAIEVLADNDVLAEGGRERWPMLSRMRECSHLVIRAGEVL